MEPWKPWNQADFCPDMGTCQQCYLSNSAAKLLKHRVICSFFRQQQQLHSWICITSWCCCEGSSVRRAGLAPRGDLAQLLARRTSALVVLVRGDYWCGKGICGWGWEGETEGSIFSQLSSGLSVPASMLFGCDEHHGGHLLEWLH